MGRVAAIGEGSDEVGGNEPIEGSLGKKLFVRSFQLGQSGFASLRIEGGDIDSSIEEELDSENDFWMDAKAGESPLVA
jgi:hypothetical protein